MIKIHNKLWACIAPHRNVEGSDFNLSYMTHIEYTKAGKTMESFNKRKSTATNWASYHNYPAPKKLTFDNTPVKGFKIVGSASRWSTQNKLIQIEDPRGFVIEIPTGNLATLLKYCVVKYAVVEDACVWGKEGNDNILLPIESDIYKRARDQTNEDKSRIPFSKLEVGDCIRFNVDDKREFIYAGRGKAIWAINDRQAISTDQNNWMGRRIYRRGKCDKIVSSTIVQDNKLCFIFIRKEFDNYNDIEYKTSGSSKCVLVKSGQSIPESNNVTLYLPARVSSKLENHAQDYLRNWETKDDGRYFESEFQSIEMKESK